MFYDSCLHWFKTVENYLTTSFIGMILSKLYLALNELKVRYIIKRESRNDAMYTGSDELLKPPI